MALSSCIRQLTTHFQFGVMIHKNYPRYSAFTCMMSSLQGGFRIILFTSPLNI